MADEADMSRPMGLFDLPPEILDLILQNVHKYHRRPRRKWAIKVSTTSKAFYTWVLPIIWDYLWVSDETRKHWFKKSLQSRYDLEKFWAHLSRLYDARLASNLKVLSVEEEMLSGGHYVKFLQLLSRSQNLVALGVCHQSMTSVSTKRKATPIETQQPGLPWQFDPHDLLGRSGNTTAALFPRLERIVLLDGHPNATAEHYANLFVNPITKSSICPALVSICLIVQYIAFDDKFVDAMVTFCSHHQHIRQLEFSFDQNRKATWHKRDRKPCNREPQVPMSLLNDLVSRADVSVKLHYNGRCKDASCSCHRVQHKEHMGRNSLLVCDMNEVSDLDGLYEYKSLRLFEWCRNGYKSRQQLLDDFDILDDDEYYGQNPDYDDFLSDDSALEP